MNRVFHPSFLNNDLPNLENSMERKDFETFLFLLEKEYEALEHHPIEHSSPCRYPPLSDFGFRKDKFYSYRKRHDDRKKADMRLIFYCDKQTIYYLAIGKRHTGKNEQGVYSTAKTRLPDFQMHRNKE